MKPVWVVAVRDHQEDFTFYGHFHTASSAQLFCDRVNSLIEKWQRENADEHGPIDTAAWAYVERITRSPSSLQAFLQAVKGQL